MFHTAMDGQHALCLLHPYTSTDASETRSTLPTISHVFIFVCIPPLSDTSEYINFPVSQILMLILEMEFICNSHLNPCAANVENIVSS